MGFWSNLFGKKKPELLDMDIDTEVAPAPSAPISPVTPISIEEFEKQVEDLLRDLFPSSIETYETEQQSEADALEEKKRKRSEAAKKAAATRAANKAKK